MINIKINYWMNKSRYITLGIILLGTGLFMCCAMPVGQAIGIAHIFIGLAIFAVDHFSGDRAEAYYQKN